MSQDAARNRCICLTISSAPRLESDGDGTSCGCSNSYSLGVGGGIADLSQDGAILESRGCTNARVTNRKQSVSNNSAFDSAKQANIGSGRTGAGSTYSCNKECWKTHCCLRTQWGRPGPR